MVVKVDVPSAVLPSTQAMGKTTSGNQVPVGEGRVILGAVGEPVFLPLALEPGTKVSEFDDPGKGIVLTTAGGEAVLTIPMRGSAGDAVLLRATLEGPPEGTGESVSSPLKKLEIVVPPTEADFRELDPRIGKVTFRANAAVTTLGTAASFTTAVYKSPDQPVLNSLQAGAERDGATLKDVAYSVRFLETNITTGPATVVMTVGREWMASQIGRNPSETSVLEVIRIARTGEDGTTMYYPVSFTDLQADPMVFSVQAPSLSAYSLVAIIPGVTSTFEPQPVETGTGRPLRFYVLLGAAVIGVTMGGFIFWRSRR